MKTLEITKPNRTKIELFSLLETQLHQFNTFIKENNATLTKSTDGYNLSVEKRVLFMKYFLNAEIIAGEEKYIINYDTNAPEFKVKEFETKVIDHLKSL
jgi:hypothetical protein